jgi:hypothetical protein
MDNIWLWLLRIDFSLSMLIYKLQRVYNLQAWSIQGYASLLSSYNLILLVTQNFIGSFDFNEFFYIVLAMTSQCIRFLLRPRHAKSAFSFKLFIK